MRIIVAWVVGILVFCIVTFPIADRDSFLESPLSMLVTATGLILGIGIGRVCYLRSWKDRLETGHQSLVWFLTFVVWIAGVVPIYLLWNYHPSPEWVDELLGFAVYLVAFFYILALLPIRSWVSSWLRGYGPHE
jgi:hypothetical protein